MQHKSQIFYMGLQRMNKMISKYAIKHKIGFIQMLTYRACYYCIICIEFSVNK